MKTDEKQKPASRAKIDFKQTHEILQLPHNTPLTTLRCDPAGQFIAAGAQDLDVHLWRLDEGMKQQGAKQTLKGHDSWVRHIAFSPDSRRMYTACWGGAVKAWDITADEPKQIYSLAAHEGAARWVSVSPDGKQLATCGNDLLVKIWKAADGAKVNELKGHERHVYGTAFHPSGTHIVSQDLISNVKVWELATGKAERSFTAKMMTGYDKKFAADMGGSRDLHIRADGAQWASAGITKLTNGFAGIHDPIIVVFDWKTGEVVDQFVAAGNFKGIAWGVRFHPQGFIIGAGAQNNGKGELWFYQPGNSKPVHTVKLSSAARALDFVDESRLAVAHADGKVRLYAMTPKTETDAKS